MNVLCVSSGNCAPDLVFLVGALIASCLFWAKWLKYGEIRPVLGLDQGATHPFPTHPGDEWRVSGQSWWFSSFRHSLRNVATSRSKTRHTKKSLVVLNHAGGLPWGSGGGYLYNTKGLNTSLLQVIKCLGYAMQLFCQLEGLGIYSHHSPLVHSRPRRVHEAELWLEPWYVGGRPGAADEARSNQLRHESFG